MKKLLGILILDLLFNTSALTGYKAKFPILPKDVSWRDKYFKSLVGKD